MYRSSVFFFQFLSFLIISFRAAVFAVPADSIPGGYVIIDARDTLFRELDEIVVHAFDRRQEIVRIPGALTSVGSIVIEREAPSINVLPVFQHVPGVFAQEGATNTSRVIIRGTGARVPYATGKIRAYFNNIPLTNTSGVSFMQDIDPAVIQSIEVIKGPAPSSYGAGLGGTIVLNAREPSVRNTGLSNSSQVGAFGLLRNATTVDLVRQNMATSLVYSITQREGYRENNEFNRNAITSISQLKLSPQWSITGLFSFSDLKSHIPSSVDSVTFVDSPRNAAANWLRTRGYEDSRRFLGGVNTTFQPEERVSLQLSVFSLWHDEKEMRPFDVFFEERFTLGSRLLLQNYDLAGVVGLVLSAGGEFFTENYFHSNHENINGEGVQGDPFSDNRERVNTFNVFFQVDWSLQNWNFSAGVNMNHSLRIYEDRFHTGPLNLSGNYSYGYILSPRLAASYSYVPDNAVYLSIGHGFAPPSLDETLTPDGGINPDILPEKSWNLELGLRGKLLERRWFYDLALYRMVVQDLLVAQRVAEDTWIGRNAGESLHLGLELENQWIIRKQSAQSGSFLPEISLRNTITWNDFLFTDFVDRGVDYSGNKLPGVPDYMVFVGLFMRSAPGVYLMPSFNYVGPVTMNDANSKSTKSYSLVDLTLGYHYGTSQGLRLELFAKVHNLLDQRYSSMILVNAPSFGGASPRYYYPGLPSHFTFGLRLQI